jgi:hypothetical protein
VWGCADRNHGVQASRVAVILERAPQPSEAKEPLLPHKREKKGSRPALPRNCGVTSFLLQRLPGCSPEDWRQANEAARLWLVAGCLGARANRAAGSVWPCDDWTPRTDSDLRQRLAPLLNVPSPWAAALIGSGNDSWETLRETASDTLKNLRNLFGSAEPRTPSPTKFKIVELDSGLRLLALAKPGVSLAQAEKELRGKKDDRRWLQLGEWIPLQNA